MSSTCAPDPGAGGRCCGPWCTARIPPGRLQPQAMRLSMRGTHKCRLTRGGLNEQFLPNRGLVEVHVHVLIDANLICRDTLEQREGSLNTAACNVFGTARFLTKVL